MAGAWRTISVALRADASGYTPVLRTAAGETERFGTKTDQATKKASGAWKALSLAAKGGGIAIGLALIQAGRSAIQFEARMRNVASLGGISEKQLKSLSGQVLELSKRFPQSANDLAEGLYDIASSSFKGQEGIDVLTASAKAASAGLTTTANSAKAITAVLNAYGLEAESATDVSDTLFQTVNVGVINFEQLSGVIGDVVGTAAAATVGIDEIGAALATMTLSGISADEAGTSLNRLLQAIIDPSDSLAQAINQVGYESGAAALKQDDLNVVMDKLLTLSKGNIETLLQWFPEIRAARGALALAAADGSNYADAVKALDDAHKGEGATERAFAEQMKSTSAQLKLVVNDVNAAGIALGTQFLPYITAAIEGLRDLGNHALPFLRDRMDDLQAAAHDLGIVIGEIVDYARPSVELLLQLGGAAVLGAITGLFKGLRGVASILSEHPALVRAITTAMIALAAIKTWNVLLVGVDMFRNHLSNLAEFMERDSLGRGLAATGGRVKLFTSGLHDVVTTGANMTAGLGKMRASLSGLGAALATPQAALAGLAIAFAVFQAQNDALDRQAGRTVQGIVGSSEDAVTRISKLRAEAARLTKEQGENVLDLGPVHIGLTEGDAKDAARAHKELGKVNDALHDQFALLAQQQHVEYDPGAKNAKAIERQLIATDKLTKAEHKKALARRANEVVETKVVTSAKAFLSLTEEEQTSIAETAGEISAFSEEMGLLGPTVQIQAGVSAEAFKGLAKDAQKFIEDVSSSFADYGNIVSGLSGDTDVTGEEIRKFYTRTSTNTRHFMDDIRAGVERGLDPQFIAELLQAGPEQAGPLLQTIVDDNSNNLITMVNDSEEALRDLNASAVEMARLTNQAVTSQSSDMAANLDKAMKISQFIMASGGKASAAAIAKELGIGALEVFAIAQQYGINLAAGLNPVLQGIGTNPIIVKAAHMNKGGENAPGFDVGGFIDPRTFGDTRRDSVAARLMPGEVVVRRSSVNRFGIQNLLDLNKGKVPVGWSVPGYASGGFVSPGDVPFPPDVSGHGTSVGYAGGRTMDFEYQKVIEWVKKNALGIGAPVGAIQNLAKQMLDARGWGGQWAPFAALVAGESGWRVDATNPSSGAYGIPQALPPGKMASAGADWKTSARTQLAWMMDYIGGRYVNPAGAYSAWSSRSPHWYSQGGRVPVHSYDRGGYLPEGLSLAYNGTGRPEPVNVAAPNVQVHFYVDGHEFRGMARAEVHAGDNRRAVVVRKGVRV